MRRGEILEQIVQKLMDGRMQVLEVPIPALQPGHILVKNAYSLISAGTEGSTVKTARAGLLTKAKERPQQVKQVLSTIRSHGVVQTYRAVMKKLDAYSPLGYSTAGVVVDVAPDVREFQPGDMVACGGLTAAHAEVVGVPVNLCVKLPSEADLKQAAYNTLGAIALQGVRQADLRLGETCAVIGLGLLGQITCLLLKASGVKVIGIDINVEMVKIAQAKCADVALARDAAGIEDRIFQFTTGLGCDAVIITAATPSLDPVNFAGAVARKKGTVVIVGAVPTGFDREPHYYKKELQVRMSCSYGPGRYDPQYEEKGIDYPVAYVRWTENRNMQAFQDLISAKTIDLSYLTTHVFKLEEAPKAYDMMMSKSEPFIGILIEYDASKEFKTARVELTGAASRRDTAAAGIGFIGAGSYAQGQLLPHIPKDSRIALKGVMTATGTNSRSVGERFGFAYCTANAGDILGDAAINTVFIATRHDTHADYVLKALNAGKHVFVEKPLCLTEQELSHLAESYEAKSSQGNRSLLMVGYNRRFSSLSQWVKDALGTGPKAMICRVNAGAIPKDSWIQDVQTGGGRIIGEVCHFIDLLSYFAGSVPVSVYASAMKAADQLQDTVNIHLTYGDGSIGTICYYANGDKSLPKEYMEVFSHHCTAIIDDFREASLYRNGSVKRKKLLSMDKGQQAEVEAFMSAILNGAVSPISFNELAGTSLVTFKILESLRTGNVCVIDRAGLISWR